MTHTQEIIKHLKKLGTGEIEPSLQAVGICNELYYQFGDDSIEVIQTINLMPKWPKASPSVSYPVPLPDSMKGEGLGKYGNHLKAYHCNRKLWANDDYGDLRRELCLWLANELKYKELGEMGEIEI